MNNTNGIKMTEPSLDSEEQYGMSPRQPFYRNYFHNLFIDIDDLGRKEKIAKRDRGYENEEHPEISGNPSQFCVTATVRKTILNKWARIFFSPIDIDNDFEETDGQDETCPCSKSAINIGMTPIFTLLRESRLAYPGVCSKALLSLLDMLNQHNPEELSVLPSKVLDDVIEILFTSSCVLGAEYNTPDDGTSMTAVSCSSLVAAVLAKGNTGQILKTIYTLFTSPTALVENQPLLLPKICIKLQCSAQALVMGNTSFPKWMTHGVQKASVYDKFYVKSTRNFDPYSMCSDGMYLYLYTSRGLFKIGSGYMNTIKGQVYETNTMISKEGNGFIGILQGVLYLKVLSCASSLIKLSTQKLEVLDVIDIHIDFPFYNGVFFSNGRNLGIISSGDDGMSLQVSEINTNIPRSCTQNKTLKITEKHCYIIEGECFNDAQFYKNLKPTVFNYGLIKSEDICEIAKGHSFTIIRLNNGKVYFSGLGSVLGYNNLNKDDSPWTEMAFCEFHIIKKMAVGHDGQHAVFITDGGDALFTGTSQWGEDGELPKIGRQPRVIKIKTFMKIKNENIVDVSCNYGTSAFVTEKGELYMYGKDASYCDASGKLNLINEHVTQVALGKAHVAILTIAGNVYTFGLNNKGQCGRASDTVDTDKSSDEGTPRKTRRPHSRKFVAVKRIKSTIQIIESAISKTFMDDPYQLPPGQIALKEKVVFISCGLHHTVLLTDKGEVYSCGSNLFGQLGVGNTSPQRGLIKLCVPAAQQIAAGSHHTVILTKAGEVYTLGSNNAGQLVRRVGNGVMAELWATMPGCVIHLAPSYGYKAMWVGASGDATFINTDKALINMKTLVTATVTSNNNNLVILPRKSEHTFNCIVINTMSGECNSFNTGDQVKFVNTLACMDPQNDVMWQYVPERHIIKCYNKMIVGARNIKECSLFDSLYLKDLGKITVNSIANADRRSLSILSSELSIPKVENCFITRAQLAINILACFDTYYTAHLLNLPLHIDTPPPIVDKETGYQMINRFPCCREVWDYDGESGIDAIRFMCDFDLTLGGVMLYGGCGEVIAKIKIYDLGYGDADDKEGKVIGEIDDVVYNINVGQKYPVCLENPIVIKAHRWHMIWADISGRVVEFGEAGVSMVTFYDSHIYFASSKLSTKYTNINYGQFPTLLVKGLPDRDSKSGEIHEPVHLLTYNFGTNISCQGLDALQAMLLWSWNKIQSEIWDYQHVSAEEQLNRLKYFEKLEYITCATLRIIKSCLNHIYPKKASKKSRESKDFVSDIYEIRQLLILIMNYKILDIYNERSRGYAGPQYKHIISNILKECCQTFQELFHIFYPTPYLKWEILCTLLVYIKNGVCTRYDLILSAVLASLSRCVTQNLVVPVLFSNDSNDAPSKNTLLVEKMAHISIGDSKMDAQRWHLNVTLEHLLELVLTPIKKQLQNDYINNENNNNLIKNACDLLMRIVAEFAFNAVGEYKDILAPGVRGCVISTPSRFLEINHRLEWNGSQEFPDIVCFEVDRPGIGIVGINIYCSPGFHNYQLEIHEDCSKSSVSRHPWKCLSIKKGTLEPRGGYISDTCEVKFKQPILIKENRKYAIRIWYVGAPTKSGLKGVTTVKGTDGTIFKFSKQPFSHLCASTIRGQIPSILYFRDSNLSLLSSTEGIAKFPAKHILKVAQVIIKKCAECLGEIRTEFTLEQIKNCKELNRTPSLNNLLPFTLAHLSHLTDPESCLNTLQMVHDLLPHVAALNRSSDDYDRQRVPMTNNDKRKLLTDKSQHIIVESAHPYKHATVVNYRVTFPDTITWMSLEMDPRSGTAQLEDSIRVFVSRSYHWNTGQFNTHSDSFDSCDGDDDPQTECESVFKPTVTESGANIEISNKLTLVPVTPKLSCIKKDWPEKAIIVPGNELFFSMETSTDYAKNENANRFGFKCLVVGYEDLSEISSDEGKAQNVFSKLEMELSYIGGMCAASMMNPTMSAPDVSFMLSLLDETEILSTRIGASSLEHIDDNILRKGFTFLSTPDIHEALSGVLPIKCNSKEFTFLQDFINCTGNTAGARLARWLQPDPNVDISLCQLIIPEGDQFCDQEVAIMLHIRDQNGQPLHDSDLNVQMIVNMINSNPDYNPERVSDMPIQPPPFGPDEGAPKNPNLSDWDDDNYEDNACGGIPEARESLIIKNYSFAKLCGTWIPQHSGVYSVKCTIDGQMKESQYIKVRKPSEGFVPQLRESIWTRKSRSFYADDSGGLRVRSLPSLQGEQLGLIPVGSSLTYEDVEPKSSQNYNFPNAVRNKIDDCSDLGSHESRVPNLTENFVINGDGLWLQLSEESIVVYCDDSSNGTEAWCLQYNEHVGKSFLFPNDKILSYWEKLVEEPTDSNKVEYLVMFPTYVWTGYGPTSTVYFTIDAGKIVSIEKMYVSEGVSYGKLDALTLKTLGLYDDGSKEFWIICSPINTHCVSHQKPDNASGESQPKVHKPRRMHDATQEMVIGTMGNRSVRNIFPFFGGFQRNPDGQQHAGESEQDDDDPQYPDFKRIREFQDDSPRFSDINLENRDIDSRYTRMRRMRNKFTTDAQRMTFNFPEIEEYLAKQEKMNRNCPKLPRESQKDGILSKGDRADGTNGVENCLSRAKSFRAIFAAFLWHEGIVHDAMACAAYLKFHPTLPKQGTQVVTRNITKLPSLKIPERHSVEVSNAGHYLNMLDTNMESLAHAAFRARGKRSKQTPDVTMIREEDSTNTLPKTEKEVVCVLPAALRALLALWDSMSEILPQKKHPLTHDEIEDIQDPYAPPYSPQHITLKDRPGELLHILFCKYCNTSIETFDFIHHMEKLHPGCGKNLKGLLAFFYGGESFDGEEGICGDTVIEMSHRLYYLCKDCNDKYCNKFSDIRETFMHGRRLKPAKGNAEMIENWLFTKHTIMRKNAIFLLHLIPSTSNDDERKRSDSTEPHQDIWAPVKQFQCLHNLLDPCVDENSAIHEDRIFGAPHQSTAEGILVEQLDDNDNGNNLNAPNYTIDPGPSTSGTNTRFHRSVSMGQDAFHNFPRMHMGKTTSNKDTLGSSSSLLCNPSAALRALIEFDSDDAASQNWSITHLKVKKEMILRKDVMKFIFKPQSVKYTAHQMVNSVRTATMRKYSLKAFNWLLHTVTQPTCLHDLMWWFADGMNKNFVTRSSVEEAEKQEEEEFARCRPTVPWGDSLDNYGNNIHINAREELHKFLYSICQLMSLLPPASALLLQAVRTCSLNFSAQDHSFLHGSGLIKTLSKILSHSDEVEYHDEAECIFKLEEFYKSKPTLKICNDMTPLCDIKVSSNPAGAVYLTDGTTETFWETAEVDATRPNWIQIVFPHRVFRELSFICLHIDNSRDIQNKTELVDIRIGTDMDDIQHFKNYNVRKTGNNWILCSLPVMRDISVIVIELRGFDATLRVRQLLILDEPYKEQVCQTARSILHTNIEVETLKIFKFIASQVFERVNITDSDTVESEFQKTNNDLKEHMVGVLFSRNKFTTLQKQIMTHIISAIQTETRRIRESWDKLNSIVVEDTVVDVKQDDYSSNPDEYCFQMLSMILALSGSHAGCIYLAEHKFVISDLLSLLHTGSGRVQRQVIAIIRRMIKDISPQDINSALVLKRSSICNASFFDHMMSCVCKSLSLKVKGISTQTLELLSVNTYNELKNKLLNGMLNIRECLRDLPAGLWFFRGQISRNLSEMVTELLTDLLQGKITPQWSEATQAYIVDAILKLTNLTDNDKMPLVCLAIPTLWVALGSLGILQPEQVERLSSLGFDNSLDRKVGEKDIVRPYCWNHDDGFTQAIIECEVCGPNCQDCDRILHLHRKNKSHKRQVCKAVKDIIRVDVHEGCGRVKLFWLLALVDRHTFKALVEFRNELENFCSNDTVIYSGTSMPTGVCRYCGKQNNAGLLAIGNVCADQECQEISKIACVRYLRCGHQCGGILHEEPCLPCLKGCASSPQQSSQLDQAAAILTPMNPIPLRQDSDDMCMICFSDPLSAAPAIQFKCGHVFHYICTLKILENKWCGPRINFNFSRCPICKENIEHRALEEILLPIRELEDAVQKKALARLDYDGQKEAAVIATRYKGDTMAYAMDRYAYYICYKCKKPYFGGEARCDTEAGLNTDYNEEELVCGGCSNIACGQVCAKHGDDFLEYKCRFCCSIAVFFCLGDSHFCSACHDEFQRIRNIPVENLPHCPAGSKGIQLDGTEDDCPLGVKHSPTGQEYALGCGICRNKTKKF